MKTNYLTQLLAACVVATVMVLLTSCAADQADSAAEPVVESTPTESPYVIAPNGEITLRTDCDGVDIHWEYEGADGPDYWDDLCTDWACGGYQQSPVNIVPPPVRRLSKSLRFYWKNTETHIVNNGHTVQYNIDQPSNQNDRSYISLNGQRFYLLQFHFHAASEHTVNGEHYPAEIHFVHQNPLNGQLAVIGVFVEEGAANPFFADIHDLWPHDEGHYDDASSTFNPNMLMPSGYNNFYKAHFWYYDGSLTTPPCSEIVNWMVWSTTIEASHEQIMEMESVLHENYRPVQPLDGRLVKAQ
ncbi:MAG: carbonic anhydrase family protein [Saprospiraceae bacterium]